MSGESPEQLLDAFKAAALSVTKLFKTSAQAQAKARTDGYQDCLDDLLSFLEKEAIGLSDGDGRRIRRWISERQEGRDVPSQSVESDDEIEKTETLSSPEIHRSNSATELSSSRRDASMRDSAPPTVQAAAPVPEPTIPEPEVVVPTLETFNFQPQHPYPPYLNLANLDLSDSHNTAAPPVSRNSGRTRHGNGTRTSSRTGNHLGRGAGQKRKLNMAEIFGISSLGSVKDPFGSGGKRSRHT